MDRDELAQKVANARFDYGRSELPEGCKIVVSDLDRDIADAALSYFREYLGREETVEAAARTMQESKAWPAVHQAGTAELLARAALTAIGGHDEKI
jgi:hypothetical protein